MNPKAQLANSIFEACRRLSIGKSTFHELVRDGQLKVVKIGRKTLIPESELLRFIGSLAREPMAAVDGGGA